MIDERDDGGQGSNRPSTGPDPGTWTPTTRTSDLALLFLRSRRRDPCAERVAIELERRRTPADLAAISDRQGETLLGVINAVLDGIGLTPEQRTRGVEIAVAALRRASEEGAR